MSAETKEFKTEMKQLMEIIIHSLYSHREIFLRELISNAADAVDKARFKALTDESIVEDDSAWKIKIDADKEAGTLTITDNGIGMSRETIVEDLGTIARSGTRAFLDQMKEAKDAEAPELIGQFGVGFYSAFMVADKVTVTSRAAGADEAVRWESDGHGEYTVDDAEKDTRGTEICLHLREDATEYLDEWRVREIVRKFSDFLEHPVVMDVERTEKGEEGEEDKTSIEEETLNSQQALWVRPKSEITDEQYEEFYKHVSHDYEAPARTIHYSAEGVMEFKSILFIPSQRPFDLFTPDSKMGLQLYIKRVFITDQCKELMPEYLRFVKGVVDSSDLPLNVSREMMQDNPMLAKIQKNLVSKILGELAELKEKEYDAYVKFYENFGIVMKEGLHVDFANKDKLADLLLLRSTKSGADEYVTLKDYVEAMPSDQEHIYYLTGDNHNDLSQSPHLEVFKSRGQEVLLFTDPIDEWVVQALTEYGGKQLKAADRGEVKEDGEEESKDEEAEKPFVGVFGVLKEKLEAVKDVRLSTRLTESAACLVVDEGDMSAHMERLMQRMGRDADMPESKRILELNGEHPVVKALVDLHEKDADDARIGDYGQLLLDQAMIAEGTKISDPSDFAKRLNTILERDLAASA